MFQIGSFSIPLLRSMVSLGGANSEQFQHVSTNRTGKLAPRSLRKSLMWHWKDVKRCQRLSKMRFCMFFIHSTLQCLAVPGFSILPVALVKGTIAPLLEGSCRCDFRVIADHRNWFRSCEGLAPVSTSTHKQRMRRGLQRGKILKAYRSKARSP